MPKTNLTILSCFLFQVFFCVSSFAQENNDPFNQNHFWKKDVQTNSTAYNSRSTNMSVFKTSSENTIYRFTENKIVLQQQKDLTAVSSIQFYPAISSSNMSANFRYLECNTNLEGISMKFKHAEKENPLIYKYTLQPNASLNEVQWNLEETCTWQINANGNLVIEDEAGLSYTIAPPTAYQTIRSEAGISQSKIKVSFSKLDHHSIGFTLNENPNPNFRFTIEGNL